LQIQFDPLTLLFRHLVAWFGIDSLRYAQITKARRKQLKEDGLAYATSLIKTICALAGEPTLIEDSRAEFAYMGLLDAIQRHDDNAIFNWLIEAVSYQGVSDAVASTFIDEHGCISAIDIKRGLANSPRCHKLRSYWHFNGCGFRKTFGICNQQQYFAECPLPKHDSRNGSLSQAAYSLYLFMRDVAGGDFVSWLDNQLERADRPKAYDRVRRLVDALVGPLRYVHGVSDKVLNMSLATLLLAGDATRERWIAAGAGMIAIDTLVHNWLHRSGVLRRMGAEHNYGPQCYGDFGCAAVIECVSRRIDARKFNPDFPKVFPRFVQKAIWNLCAQSGFDICNGNQVDDSKRCQQIACPIYDHCGRVALNPPAR
jgi:hypothetical protein